jgi:hypothetical protein
VSTSPDEHTKPPSTFAEVEDVFIDDRWNYGLSIHEKSAEALCAALGDPSEAETGHALFARLYGEYAGSLETFGALGLAIRSRTTPGSLVKTYVTYRTAAVKSFYKDVAAHDGDLSSLLNFQRAEHIIGLATARQDDVGTNVEKFATSLEELYARFKSSWAARISMTTGCRSRFSIRRSTPLRWSAWSS